MTTIDRRRMTGKAAIPVLIIIAFLTMYFIFFANSPPSEISFQGHILGPREETENNSNKDFRIFSYKDRSANHMLLLLMPEDDSVTADELIAFYAGNFETQGFSFSIDGTRQLGLRDDEAIYLTTAANLGSAIAYIEKGGESAPRKPDDADSLFLALERFSFD